VKGGFVWAYEVYFLSKKWKVFFEAKRQKHFSFGKNLFFNLVNVLRTAEKRGEKINKKEQNIQEQCYHCTNSQCKL
jgi:GH43 family beta-xylosidase